MALVQLCAQQSVQPIVHMITDGRDTAPVCAGKYLADLDAQLADANGMIGTVIGRYFAMDRDQRWDRIRSAWEAIVFANGRLASAPQQALQLAKVAGENDEFISPTVIDGYQPPLPDDEFIFFNFRNDRPRELSEALAFTQFGGFDRGRLSTRFIDYHDALPVKLSVSLCDGEGCR